MKVIVPIKQVGDLDDEFEVPEEGEGLDRDLLELSLNEWDKFSVEAAVALAETAPDGEVVVVTVGGDDVDEALVACLAAGATRAAHIAADDGLDTLAVAEALAAFIRRESADLVLCGVQSSDSANGATGIALAALLEVPRAAVVVALEYAADTGTLTVERELEGGTRERLQLPTPALLTIQTGINHPRYANLRAIKQARSKPIERLTPDALGLGDALERAAGARVRRLVAPARGAGAVLLEGDADRVAEQIGEIIEKALVA